MEAGPPTQQSTRHQGPAHRCSARTLLHHPPPFSPSPLCARRVRLTGVSPEGEPSASWRWPSERVASRVVSRVAAPHELVSALALTCLPVRLMCWGGREDRLLSG
jgi:hypothetical protein